MVKGYSVVFLDSLGTLFSSNLTDFNFIRLIYIKHQPKVTSAQHSLLLKGA